MQIFEKGCLVHLHISCWTGRTRLESDKVSTDSDQSLIEAFKFLVEKECLEPIKQVENSARAFLKSKSFNFPIPGVYFVLTKDLPEVDTELKRLQEKHALAIDEFVQEYHSYVEAVRDKLRSNFNPKNYPPNIRDKFNFTWLFLTLSEGDPSHLSPELYLQEKQKFTSTIRNFTESVYETVLTECATLVDNLLSRLKEGKRFKENTIDNLRNIVATVKELDLSDGDNLKAFMANMESKLEGVSAGRIRSNAEFKARVIQDFSMMHAEIREIGKRKVSVPKEEAEIG